MVNGDFGVSKNVKVFETKEIREGNETDQGHNFCFAVGTSTSVPMYIKSLTFFRDYINTTGAYVMLGSAIKKGTGKFIDIDGLLIRSLFSFGDSRPIKRSI